MRQLTLLQDILGWSATLPGWQSDALRRLLTTEGALSKADCDELYAMLKRSHGLAVDAASPIPLNVSHLPGGTAQGSNLVLSALRDLQHVNRLSSSERLNFAPDGITVVYGPNAAGKSGYARVMKRACRARDKEQVLPDANQAASPARVPSATFDVTIDGVAASINWTADAAPPDGLSSVAVFDSRCARVYLSDEREVEYLPYGLDAVESLAKAVIPEVSSRLEEETARLNVDVSPFAHLAGDTAVGALVSSLSRLTKRAQIDALARLSEDDLQRMARLKEVLAEADPRARAKDLRLQVARLKRVADHAKLIGDRLSDDSLDDIMRVRDEAQLAIENEREAAKVLRSGESLLPGTGDSVWRVMFEAARRYSMELAYAEKPFPNTEPAAACMLCQQPLSESAAERLLRFERFVRQDVASIADNARRALGQKRRELSLIDVACVDTSMMAEIEQLDAQAAKEVLGFEAGVAERRRQIVAALDGAAWSEVTAMPPSPRSLVRRIAARRLLEARAFERAAECADREALETELRELEARMALGAVAKSIWTIVENMGTKAELEKCKKELRTKPISDKSKEFGNKAVTAALKKALEREFADLNLGHISLALQDRNDRGTIKHKLVLDLPKAYALSAVLSEGEQRAIALAAFLAEASLGNVCCAMVFDDPVSSLDHTRRQLVAKRLVAESAKRQVVVFTHDTTFLGQLRDEIDKASAPHVIRSLEWIGNNPGHVSDGLPWDHQGVRARIDTHEKRQRELKRLPWPVYPNEEQSGRMRHEYSLLRATLERVIQEVLLAGVVRRYRDWIRVDKLSEVALGVNPDCCADIAALHKRCCDVVSAHDPVSDKNGPVPTADELATDIAALKALVERINEERRAAERA